MKKLGITVVVFEYFNTSFHLKNCLDIILNQTYKENIDIIVVDMNKNHSKYSLALIQTLANYPEFDENLYKEQRKEIEESGTNVRKKIWNRKIVYLPQLGMIEATIRNEILKHVRTELTIFTKTNEIRNIQNFHMLASR